MVKLEQTPLPTPTMTVAPELVSPGPIGFAIMGVVVIAAMLLIFDMQRRIRRARYREQVREKLDAEQSAATRAAENDKQAATE